jgi:hypothetical protein
MVLEIDQGRGIRDDGVFLERGDTTKWPDPLPLSPYHPHKLLKSPKSGIPPPSISIINHHQDGKRKT